MSNHPRGWNNHRNITNNNKNVITLPTPYDGQDQSYNNNRYNTNNNNYSTSSNNYTTNHNKQNCNLWNMRIETKRNNNFMDTASSTMNRTNFNNVNRTNSNNTNVNNSCSRNQFNINQHFSSYNNTYNSYNNNVNHGIDYKHLSKTCCWILRHGAKKIGLQMNDEGYVKIQDLLNTYQLRKMRTTFLNITKMVELDNKNRYDIKNNFLIRCNQGHNKNIAVNDEKLLTRLTINDLLKTEKYKNIIKLSSVVHGTYKSCINSIIKNGLSKMSRRHIHFSVKDKLSPNTKQSGFRDDCDYIIYINIVKAIKDGIPFYLSLNNVILSPGNEDGYIINKYFFKIARYNKYGPNKVVWARGSKININDLIL